MELTLDDCIALAARECATERELRAALCVAVGQALHARYEARAYGEALDACRAERDALRARPTYEARTVAPTSQECAAHWLPLDRDGLPCAWPVPGEVTL